MSKKGLVDEEYDKWDKEMYGSGANGPAWPERKKLFAEHLLATKSKSWIWGTLCGPATGPCRCNCMCPSGIAWNALLERESKEE